MMLLKDAGLIANWILTKTVIVNIRNMRRLCQSKVRMLIWQADTIRVLIKRVTNMILTRLLATDSVITLLTDVLIYRHVWITTVCLATATKWPPCYWQTVVTVLLTMNWLIIARVSPDALLIIIIRSIWWNLTSVTMVPKTSLRANVTGSSQLVQSVG